MKFYEKSFLENGIRVLTQQVNSIKSFTLGIWVNVGSRDEDDKLNGLSHFIEHCAFKGTKNRSSKKIAVDVEKLGGYLNAFTTKEHTCFYARSLSEHFEETFEVLADLVKNPVFPDEEIEKEKAVILEEISSINDTPDEVIFDLIEKELFKSHPLGNPIIGNEENILRFNSTDARKFINENYTADKIVVSLAGPIPHQKVVEQTIKFLGNIPAVKNNSNRTEPDLFNSKIEKEIQKDINQVHICVARKTFGVKDKRRSQLALLNLILGGMTTSRLFQKIREEQALAYNTTSFLNNYYDASIFGVYLSTSFNNQNKVMDLFKEEFDNLLKNGITEDEFEIARNYLKGGISMSLENTSSKASHLAVNEFYYGEVKSIEEIFKSIDRVQKNDLDSLCGEIMNWDNFSIYKIIPQQRGKNGNQY